MEDKNKRIAEQLMREEMMEVKPEDFMSFARAVYGVYTALKASGFDEERALYLTTEWMKNVSRVG